jgi:hypothetical protein
MDSLQRQFPQLPFAKTADEWICSFKGKDIWEQLYSRRVTKVCLAVTLSGGMKIGEDGNFLIQFCDLYLSEENAEDLGHELAHTFQQDLTKNPPLDLFPEERIAPDLSDLIEKFCRAFSGCWLHENDKRGVIAFCETVKH